MFMRNSLRAILPVAVLGMGAVAVFLMVKHRRPVQPEVRPSTVPLVRTVPVQAQPYHFTVHAQGSVAPRTDILLVAEVAGRVESVAPSFAAGGFFEAGDVLVTIESEDYKLAVTRARAALAEAEVQSQREEAEAAVASREWQTLGKGKPSALLLHEPQLAEAKAAVASAQANLKLAELDLQRCQIKAPFAGRVWDKRVDVGQYLARNDKVARVYAVDYAEVRLPLPLDQVAFLNLPLEYRGEARPEQTPKVVLRAHFGGREYSWEGRIVRTEGEIDPRTRMLTAVARVDNPYGRSDDNQRPPLAVGLFVEAEIQGKTVDSVFVVPRAALRGKDHLMVVDRENRLRLRPVTVLRLEREDAVVSRGLTNGEAVCISPLDAPVDGMQVQVNQDTPPVAKRDPGKEEG